MTTTQPCEEYTGLFIVKTCDKLANTNCENCNKPICAPHTFDGKQLYTKKNVEVHRKQQLCLSCFIGFDARLTSEIELYSKDRAIWRRKMMERFHAEYPYMVFMVEEYGSLFDTVATSYTGDFTEDGSYFDS